MKKLGFTLAEVLITLMILGVIAAMTVPTLIQDTQKKEQVVQVKKGLSMINQAITMNYALEQETLSDIRNATGGALGALGTMLKKRLAVVDSNTNSVRTADGLTYYFDVCEAGGYDGENPISADNCIFNIVISTKADVILTTNPTPSSLGTGNKTIEQATTSESGVTGFYQFYSGDDRIVPSASTQEFLTTKDLKKFKGGAVPTPPNN